MNEKIKLMRVYKKELKKIRDEYLELQEELRTVLQEFLDDYIKSEKPYISQENHYKVTYDDNDDCLSFKCATLDDNLVTLLQNEGYYLFIVPEDEEHNLIVYLS